MSFGSVFAWHLAGKKKPEIVGDPGGRKPSPFRNEKLLPEIFSIHEGFRPPFFIRNCILGGLEKQREVAVGINFGVISKQVQGGPRGSSYSKLWVMDRLG